VGDRPGVRADLEYLRILHLAASTLETDVQAALELLLAKGHAVTVDVVKAITCAVKPEVPDLEPELVDLASYDDLLVGVSA
jgi:hypothetical protein